MTSIFHIYLGKIQGMDEFQGYLQLSLIIGIVSMTVIGAILRRKQREGRRDPPSPPALPIIGHLHLLAPIPHQAFHKLSTRYGPIMQILLGSVPCVIASTPEVAKEFLKTHETSFSDRFANAAVDYITYNSQGFMFAPYGPYWKFMRKICMSQVLGGRTLDQLRPLRRQETIKFLKFLLNKAKEGEVVDVGGELITLTNNIISTMTMSQTCSGNANEAQDIRKLVEDVAHIAGKFNISDYVWFCKNLDLQGMKKRLKEIRDRFDSMMEMVIKEHQEERTKRKQLGGSAQFRDLLDILLDIHEDESSEVKLTIDNIKSFILDLFLAGTHTAAITTEWTVAELINHPHVMKKARQEIDSVVGNSRIVQESDIVNLPYMQAIVKESLRLHPTVPLMGRKSSESCTVGRYQIAANTPLYINMWSIGRDPNHWENPLEFRPERFISKEGSGTSPLDVRGQHFQLIPFGSGRRVCPGTSLALQVVHTNLAAMIQCFEWKVHGDNGILDMEEKLGITLPRAHPIICVPVSRFDALPQFLI